MLAVADLIYLSLLKLGLLPHPSSESRSCAICEPFPILYANLQLSPIFPLFPFI